MTKAEIIKYIEDAIKNKQNDYNGKFIGEELFKLLRIAKSEKKYNTIADVSIIESIFKNESNLDDNSIEYLVRIYKSHVNS